MSKGSWNTAICIFIISYAFFILSVIATLKFNTIDVEYIRAFAMWSTMTIGAVGIYVAIEKFGIDLKSHTTKKLSCVYIKKGSYGRIRRGSEIRSYRHQYDLINRSDSDIYIKYFGEYLGELKKFNVDYGDYDQYWDAGHKCFIDKNGGSPSQDTNVIQPNKRMTVAIIHSEDESLNFKLRIYYSEDDFHGEEKYIETRVKYS